MPHLTVISETGFFHSAVLLEFGGSLGKKWYGFKPNANKIPIWAGKLDRSNRTDYINHYIRYPITLTRLRQAERTILDTYGDAIYCLGVKDCVSLSADAAHAAGLRVTVANMTPYGLIYALYLYNSGHTHFDATPYPWL